MRVMLGQEANMSYTRSQTIDYDDFLIRSVADGLSYQVQPERFLPGQKTKLEIELKPKLSEANAGIAQIEIELPQTLEWDRSTIEIRGDLADGKNDGKLAPFKISEHIPKKGEVFVRFEKQKIYLEFCKKNENENDVIRYNTLSPKLLISFGVRSRESISSEELGLVVSADLVLRDGDKIPWQATTGKQRGIFIQPEKRPNVIAEARK
jgi:hypothetical protein